MKLIYASVMVNGQGYSTNSWSVLNYFRFDMTWLIKSVASHLGNLVSDITGYANAFDFRLVGSSLNNATNYKHVTIIKMIYFYWFSFSPFVNWYAVVDSHIVSCIVWLHHFRKWFTSENLPVSQPIKVIV